jgi:hypothetical protein
MPSFIAITARAIRSGQIEACRRRQGRSLGGQTAKKECNRGFGNTESQSGKDEATKRKRTRREWMNPREKPELHDRSNGIEGSLLRVLPKLRAGRPGELHVLIPLPYEYFKVAFWTKTGHSIAIRGVNRLENQHLEWKEAWREAAPCGSELPPNLIRRKATTRS